MITKELIKQARQADLVTYLQKHGYEFSKEGNRYRCKQYDSLVITNKNAYFWNSRNDSGNSIDFLIKHLNMDFQTAIQELTNYKKENSLHMSEKSFQIETDIKIQASEHMDRMFAYLCHKRYIDHSIVSQLVSKGYIKMVCNAKYKYPTIAFTIHDENKQIVGYELQGTLSDVRFKGLMPNTKYGYGFNIQIKEPKKAFFFESAVDLLSFYQLCKNNILNVPLNSSILVSMAGLKVNTLCNTLTAFKIDSKACYVCVDSDKAGTNFKTALKNKNIKFREILVPEGFKDWNEYLQYVERA